MCYLLCYPQEDHPMPIATACPHCKQKLSVADQHAGNQVRCPKCRQVFLVPKVAAAPLPPAKPSPVPSTQPLPGKKQPRRVSNRLVWILSLGCAGLLALVLGGGLLGVGLWLYRAKPDPSTGTAAKVATQEQAAKGKDTLPTDEKKAGELKGEKLRVGQDGSPIANKEQVLEAQLKDGLFQTQSQLGASDFDDPIRQALRKLYEIDLQAGRKYTVELVSNDFSAHLIVEDAASFEIGEDFASGGKHKAVVACTPLKTGRHRIIVTTVGRGTGGFTLTVRTGSVKAKQRIQDLSDRRAPFAPGKKLALAAERDGVAVLDLAEGITATHFNRMATPRMVQYRLPPPP
jgi:hypothetical protein